MESYNLTDIFIIDRYICRQIKQNDEYINRHESDRYNIDRWIDMNMIDKRQIDRCIDMNMIDKKIDRQMDRHESDI